MKKKKLNQPSQKIIPESFSDKYAGKKLSEIEKQIGMETIIKQLKTWESIEAFLRTFRTKKSNNFHTYKKRYLGKYEELATKSSNAFF